MNSLTIAPARLHALIPCGGQGSRAGAGLPKQYRPVAGLPLVAHTLAAFAQLPELASVVLVVADGDELANGLGAGPHLVAHCAGATRAQTVANGLDWLLAHGAATADWVLVHDAARCLVTPALVRRLIDACRDDATGGLLALALPDTLKAAQNGRVLASVERADKWLAQTPQMFRIGVLQQALVAAGDGVTDEASALEFMGQAPLLVAGSAQNFKVTYPEDFELAEAVLLQRKRSLNK